MTLSKRMLERLQTTHTSMERRTLDMTRRNTKRITCVRCQKEDLLTLFNNCIAKMEMG